MKNANDVSAQYAFDLLHAFAGRPSAWDKADTDKDSAYSEAQAQKTTTIDNLKSQIEELRANFKEFETSNSKLHYMLRDADEIKRSRPTPLEEAKWGLAVIEDSLWNAIPKIFLAKSLK